jgi:hypothetical protein
MKTSIKALFLALAVTALTSCHAGSPSGKTDSVANNADDNEISTNSATTTVDTLPTTVDTTKADTTKK